MRVAVIGGTRFIGFAIVAELVRAGHEVTVLHRGETEPADLPPVEHIHCDRTSLPPLGVYDAVVHTIAMSRPDAEAVLAAGGAVRRLAVLSSVDVYRAFGSLLAGVETDPVPLTEASPVRTTRYPFRGGIPERQDYDKLDVEEVLRPAGAVVLRLPMVYGERDAQRREEFILRRVRAGRERIPIGSGQWLTCRAYVGDVARALRLAIEADPALVAGEVFNVADAEGYSVGLWAREILAAAGSAAELVGVPDAALPADLDLTGRVPQHILSSAAKLRRTLGWESGDQLANLQATVAWHLAHPPEDASSDFSADDRALAER